MLTFKINVLKCLCHSVVTTWSFHLQGIMTVTFEVLGDIKEENLNLFIQVNNTSLSTEVIVALYRKSSHTILFMKTFFLFIESSVGEECER